MKQNICDRVDSLRRWMQSQGLQAYIIPSTDPHASEYPPAHWECRRWISGFEGSAGTAVITFTDAALWTDSRYFLAAAEALEGTPFRLMKEGQEHTPTIARWLTDGLPANSSVGIDGNVFTVKEAMALQDELKEGHLSLVTTLSAPDDLWTQDRPALPDAPIVLQPMEWAGEGVTDKIARVMDQVERQGCDELLVSQLDDIAWLLNLRGHDVHCNPVFVAYCLVGRQGTTLYCDTRKVTGEVRDHLERNGIKVTGYQCCEQNLKRSERAVMYSPKTNVTLALACSGHSHHLMADSPIPAMKAVKNEAEIRGMRQAMLQDGVALVRWLRWLDEAVPQGHETEMTIDDKLTSLRREFDDFEGLSFDTIAAYRHHGAIVHYEATSQTDLPLKAEGTILVDTGAQYTCGTTDITRTILLGAEATPEEKRVYTLVLKGHIALSRLVFPRGACGTQLDLAARYAMWQEGYNFGHGTGHGVGAHLNVHEGPHQIRMNYVPAPIVEGMTVTDEPGIYLESRFGVRIENVLLCVPHSQTEFGSFVGFEPLTLCPIDTRLIDRTIFTPTEVEWLNDYHQTVRDKLMPLLNDEEDRTWLEKATRPLD